MRRLLFLFPLLLLLSCRQDEQPAGPDSLVVEAWICQGEPPVVQLSTSIVPSEQEQGADVWESHIIRRARVALSDGEEEVLLTGMFRKGYFPPYVYTTGHMLGEVGKTYTLTVDTPTYHATAVAQIPAPVPLESLEPERYGQGDSTWLLRARFRDRPGEHNYYKFFSRTMGQDSTFLPTRLNLIDDQLLEEEEDTEVLLIPGAGIFRAEESPFYFRGGETVWIRFCTMDEGMARVWRVFDADAVQASLPILSSYGNLPGNVTGALGFFAGYGSSTYRVTLPPLPPATSK